jgi:hypothetical protein
MYENNKLEIKLLNQATSAHIKNWEFVIYIIR